MPIKLPNFQDQLIPVERATRVGRLIALTAVVGVIAGLGGIVFEVLTEFLKHHLLDGLAGYHPPGPAGQSELFEPYPTPFRPWILAILPVLGGLVGSALVLWVAPEAEGHGTDAAIDAYHRKRGVIRARVPVVKTIASAITLATGGSAGREGPIAQIGAGFGSVMSTVLGLSAQERRILMVAGMAAGIGAVFRAPLAAALFAAEVLYREMDLEFEVIVPSVISSIVAFSVFTLAFGADPLFATPGFRFDDPWHLLPYTLLTLAVAAGARTYVAVFYWVRDFFKHLPVTPILKPVMGGAVVGLFAFFLPEAMSSGYGLVQAAFTGKVGLGLLAAVAVGKIITTSFTVASGQSGGVFGPAVVIGGLIGGAVGLVSERYLPGISPPGGAFVIVGMAGFFAAAANTPISTIIMVSEMTGNYHLLVPSMWVCVLAFLLVRRHTLYEHQLARRTDSPVHLGEMMGEVLKILSVREAITGATHEPMVTVKANASFKELSRCFAETRHSCFPVVDANGKLLGVVGEDALRQALTIDGLADVVVAADLIERAPTLIPTESLHSAMRKMVQGKRDELVVVSDEDETMPMATLSRRDLIAAYDTRIQKTLEEVEPTQGWNIMALPNLVRRAGRGRRNG
ncbi:MAG: chloride channel protein [Myxococcales bacterium]|nr:chloride channel protein [Myxococcales bacterium]